MPWRSPCTSASSRYRLKRCKTRRRAVADSHTTDRRCPPRRYDDPIIPYRSGVLSYAIRGVEVSSHRPRRPTPRASNIEETRCRVNRSREMSLGENSAKLSSLANLYVATTLQRPSCTPAIASYSQPHHTCAEGWCRLLCQARHSHTIASSSQPHHTCAEGWCRLLCQGISLRQRASLPN